MLGLQNRLASTRALKQDVIRPGTCELCVLHVVNHSQLTLFGVTENLQW